MRGYADPETDKILMEMFFGTSELTGYGIFLRFANLANSLMKPFTIWFLFCLFMNSENPFSAVLSNSMYPLFKRGDYVFSISSKQQKHAIGFIGLYEVNSSFAPVVHRIIEYHENETIPIFLSKGDNNNKSDEWLYNDQYFLNYTNIKNELIGVLPFVGYPNVFLKERPLLFVLFIYYVIYASLR